MLVTAPGATPLDPDALAGLLPGLSTQGELDEFEARNIAGAVRWAARSRTLRRDLLTPHGLRLLHRHMFDQTWRWAGEWRRVGTNIGADWPQIPIPLATLCDDARFQADHGAFGDTPSGWDEWAARFHHRLVLIHPFVNGNGRHARLAADLLLSQRGYRPFTWGAAMLPAISLAEDSPARRAYLDALRMADRGDITLLRRFARS